MTLPTIRDAAHARALGDLLAREEAQMLRWLDDESRGTPLERAIVAHRARVKVEQREALREWVREGYATKSHPMG